MIIIKVGAFYQNKKNFQMYIVDSMIQTKVNDEWQNHVYYKPLEPSRPVEISGYSREAKEFSEKFTFIGYQEFKTRY